MTETRHQLPVLLVLAVLLAACATEETPTVGSTAPPADRGGATTTTVAEAVATTVPAGTVASTVDLESLTVSDAGPWTARGLVANPTDSDETVAVTASLLDAADTILVTVSGPALVGPVRGGESVPFVLEAEVPVDQVEGVLWDVVPAPGAAGSRELEFATYWERGLDDERVVDMYLYTDPPSGERPYLLFGSVENVGSEAVSGVDVVVAWLDAGRVVWTETVDAELGDRPELEPGSAADWLIVAPPSSTPVPLTGLETRFWGMGS